MKSRVVITVLGADKVGIVAGISTVLARRRANLEDIRMGVMSDIFTMTAIADITQMDGSFLDLKTDLDQVGAELAVQVLTQREEVFKFMHRI